MNVYKDLNKITKYIDDHLECDINYEDLAKLLGTNVYITQRLFTLIAGISLSEYIRKRRLSNAGADLYEKNSKIIDIAIKYHWNNATSFSRAFTKFHGIKPSHITKEVKLKSFPRIVFNENITLTTELTYEIITLEELNLYGIGIQTNNKKIGRDAPFFFEKTKTKYSDKYGQIKYGLITYDDNRINSQKYYCLYDKEIEEFEHIKLPKSNWLKFKINSRNAKEIQDMSHRFYQEFLPSTKYKLKDLPEIEYYHDNTTDFLVAIY